MLKKVNPLIIQSVLFILTFFTTTLAGADWKGFERPGDPFWTMFATGLEYSITFLGILTIHELGHYFTAKYYKVDVTLPYYIPLFIPYLAMLQIGTMGAFIRMNSRSASKKEIFDIGIAGPLAGFVVAIGILFYGFTHLPQREYIFNVHEDYKEVEKRNNNQPYENFVYTYKYQRERDSTLRYYFQTLDSIKFTKRLKEQEISKKENKSWTNWLEGTTFDTSKVWTREAFTPQEEYIEVSMGKNLIFLFFEKYVVEDKSLIPNKYEMFHYPFLLAGCLALFFTSINLFPIGQLDGGHVLYGLFGYEKHKKISRVIFTLYIFIAGLGIFKNNILDVNFFAASALDIVYFTAIYLYFLYFVLLRTFDGDIKTTIMVAVIIFSLQFMVELIFPTFKGLNGWLVFGALVGRFLGTDHPPALIEEKLGWKRKLLGWLAFAIFILCLTPQLFVFEIFKQ